MAASDLKPCRVCGTPVSEYAPQCPKCGDPTAARYGHAAPPGRKKGLGVLGWIGLLAVIFVGWSCMRAMDRSDSGSASSSLAESSPVAGPSYELEVVDLACSESGSYAKAKVTVRNTGTTAIPYAKAFFEWRSTSGQIAGTDDTYFSPSTIPPGATASAAAMNRDVTAWETCRLSTVQDRDGNAVALSGSTK